MTYDDYVWEYEDYISEKQETISDSEVLKECKLAFLRPLKEKKFYHLFCVLEECEQENMSDLTLSLYEEELQKETNPWVQLLLIMGHVTASERECIARKYFKTEDMDAEKANLFGYRMARTMHMCFEVIEEYYIPLVQTISKAISPETDESGEVARAFLNELEHRLKVLENENAMAGERLNLVLAKDKEAYFNYLCKEMHAYRAANSFLDRFWRKEDKEKLFRNNIEETREEEEQRIKELFYQIPSPELLAWGKKYIRESRKWKNVAKEYTQAEWCADIRVVSEQDKIGKEADWVNVNKWLNVSMGIDCLSRQPEDTGALSAVVALPKFNADKHSYMTEMCCQLAVVQQKWMGVALPGEKAKEEEFLNEDRLINRLKTLGDKNLFSYEVYGKHIATYRTYGALRELINNTGLSERLYQLEDPEDMVYVYFHTPLWLFERFYTFIQKLGKRLDDTSTVEELLAGYVFAGTVVSAVGETAVNDARFLLRPRDLYWPVFKDRKEDGKSDQRRDWDYLFIEPVWLQENQSTVKKLSMRSQCTFKVVGFSTKKKFRLLVKYVYPVENGALEEREEAEIPDEKAVFLKDVEVWYESMCRDKKFHKWYGRVDAEGNPIVVAPPLKVYPENSQEDEAYQIIFSNEERIKIATGFLKVVEVLAAADGKELEKLLKNCSHPPLEAVNEFRYINVQHWTNFGFNNWIEKEREARILWENKAANLMESEHISAALKLEIYMNTCIRKVYSLETLLEKNSEIGNLLFEEGSEWVVPVRFEGYGYENGERVKTFFSMKPMQVKTDNPKKPLAVDRQKQNVMLSYCNFYYDGVIDFPKEKLPEKLRKLNGPPYHRMVMFATMKAKEGNYIKLQEYFYDSKEVKKKFPWREYKKCFYDFKKLISAKNEQEEELLKEQMLGIYNQLRKIEFSMKKEHRNTPIRKCHQIVGEMDEVFEGVALKAKRYNIGMCKDILLLLGEKNAFKNLMLLEELSEEERLEFCQYCKDTYVDSYQKFMAGIPDDGPQLIDTICEVYYLSHLQLLVDEDVFIKDVMKKHHDKSEQEVMETIQKCKDKTLQADMNDVQEYWSGESQKEYEAKKKQNKGKRGN